MADTDNVAELRSQLEQARRIAVTLEQENAELEAQLEKYVGKEPTVRDEMAYLQRCANAVYELCELARMRRHEVVTVDEVVQAVNGERPDDPADKRRRIYIDGKGNGWLDQSTGYGDVRWVAPLAIFPGDAEPSTTVRDRTGELHEIGRCW
ncbi:hypothetical protein ABZ609_03305 [Streptomyces rubiginosohelvolus]|uniref:hypothetical protein n=1 Tax=Streptomyces rubiginosohelvolus TaxID=67362 RepID=UPI0033F45D36